MRVCACRLEDACGCLRSTSDIPWTLCPLLVEARYLTGLELTNSVRLAKQSSDPLKSVCAFLSSTEITSVPSCLASLSMVSRDQTQVLMPSEKMLSNRIISAAPGFLPFVVASGAFRWHMVSTQCLSLELTGKWLTKQTLVLCPHAQSLLDVGDTCCPIMFCLLQDGKRTVCVYLHMQNCDSALRFWALGVCFRA